MTDDTTTERHDTVVIGAGQNGLTVGYHLASRQQDFVILDEHHRVGDGWRERYDSLRLYTPAKYDGLPGMAFPAQPYHFPTGAEMGDYLESYTARFALPVVADVAVDGVHADGEDYLVTAGDRCFRAANVVIATGGKHDPHTPAFADQLDPGIRQIHSDDYRNPAQLLPGDVLVVGASHSGADLALEFSADRHTVLAGPHRGEIPFDIEGRPAHLILRVLWFAANHVLTEHTPMGRKMRTEVRSHGAPLLRVKSSDLAAAGVEWVPEHVAGVRDGRPVLESGRTLDVRNVVWCTGFHQDLSWVHLPILDEDGWPRQRNGIVESQPGLYFNGLIFQSAFTSMLVGGAGRDAKRIAESIVARGGTRSSATRTAEARPAVACGRMAEQRFASVDDYIGSFSGEVRTVLERVREAVRAAVPDAGETISYHVPTVTLDGRALLHYAGWKQHVSLYPAPSGDADFERRIAPYRSGRGTLKFPLADPIPYDLIRQVAALQAAHHRG